MAADPVADVQALLELYAAESRAEMFSESQSRILAIVAELVREREAATAKIDTLRDSLGHRETAISGESEPGCGDVECSVCGVLDCPHHEPMHWHHDGCPACAQEDAPNV